MKILLAILISVILCETAFAQVKYSNEFLSIGAGARALGMSNAQVSNAEDVTAGFWNPSGLVNITSNMQIAAMHSSWFAGTAAYDYASIALPLNKKGVAALSIVRFGADDIPNTTEMIGPDNSVNYDKIKTFSATDYAFIFSYAKKTKIEGLNIGGNAKIIRRIIGDFAGAWGFGFDLGATYSKGNWKFGVMGKDITGTFNAWSFNLSNEMKQTFTATGNVIPVSALEVTNPKLIPGVSYKYNFATKFSALIAADMNMTFDGKRNVILGSNLVSFDPNLGCEIGYSNFIFLRAGLGNIQRIKEFNGDKNLTFNANLGLGLKLKNFYLDYALTNFGTTAEIPYSNVFSLKIDIFRH